MLFRSSTILNNVVHLDHDRRRYPIRVMEEQVVNVSFVKESALQKLQKLDAGWGGCVREGG